jgi:hypothetical protein
VSQERTFVNVIVVDEKPGNGDETFIQTALLGQIKMKVAELMSFVAGGVEQSRAHPGSCNPHALMLTGLGQLYVNGLHFLATTEHRAEFAEEVRDLFENLSREVEKAETMNEGGGTA